MDSKFVFPLPRLSRSAWGARRIQRQIHVQSVCSPWWVVRHISRPYPPYISQFLSTGNTLAVYRASARLRSRMIRPHPIPGVVDTAPDRIEFLDQVVAGLSRYPRTLPCKFFYDARGARLFQKICEQPEYYITRTEVQILRLRAAEIAATLGPSIELIGLGTGAGTKTQILLEELDKPAAYVPIDISK